MESSTGVAVLGRRRLTVPKRLRGAHFLKQGSGCRVDPSSRRCSLVSRPCFRLGPRLRAKTDARHGRACIRAPDLGCGGESRHTWDVGAGHSSAGAARTGLGPLHSRSERSDRQHRLSPSRRGMGTLPRTQSHPNVWHTTHHQYLAAPLGPPARQASLRNTWQESTRRYG